MNLNKFVSQVIDTPWKGIFFVRQLLLKPIAYLYLKTSGVDWPKGSVFYGLPKIFRHRESTIKIGHDFENRNWTNSNPLGINHPTIITTWRKGAQILIGNHVGISGGSFCATQKIVIGDNSLIGANCTIIDTDFHPLKPKDRRYKNVSKGKEIYIEENVFIGMNTTILKGVRIGKNSVIGAGSTVRNDVPANSIYNNGKITPLKK